MTPSIENTESMMTMIRDGNILNSMVILGKEAVTPETSAVFRPAIALKNLGICASDMVKSRDHGIVDVIKYFTVTLTDGSLSAASKLSLKVGSALQIFVIKDGCRCEHRNVGRRNHEVFDSSIMSETPFHLSSSFVACGENPRDTFTDDQEDARLNVPALERTGPSENNLLDIAVGESEGHFEMGITHSCDDNDETKKDVGTEKKPSIETQGGNRDVFYDLEILIPN
ncbi:hypothetical protein BC829DRAFT_417195 [Chytridium lagenaria]|nr:hypothetical protein BC829DRAFT_417195 [Chytridium lagenaria]